MWSVCLCTTRQCHCAPAGCKSPDDHSSEWALIPLGLFMSLPPFSTEAGWECGSGMLTGKAMRAPASLIPTSHSTLPPATAPSGAGAAPQPPPHKYSCKHSHQILGNSRQCPLALVLTLTETERTLLLSWIQKHGRYSQNPAVLVLVLYSRPHQARPKHYQDWGGSRSTQVQDIWCLRPRHYASKKSNDITENMTTIFSWIHVCT